MLANLFFNFLPPLLASTSITFHVYANNMRFNPEVLYINVGDKVSWMNSDIKSTNHTVTHKVNKDHPKLLFNSWLFPSKEFTYTFTEAGEYSYFCLPHQNMGMRGKVVVK